MGAKRVSSEGLRSFLNNVSDNPDHILLKYYFDFIWKMMISFKFRQKMASRKMELKSYENEPKFALVAAVEHRPNIF